MHSVGGIGDFGGSCPPGCSLTWQQDGYSADAAFDSPRMEVAPARADGTLFSVVRSKRRDTIGGLGEDSPVQGLRCRLPGIQGPQMI